LVLTLAYKASISCFATTKHFASKHCLASQASLPDLVEKFKVLEVEAFSFPPRFGFPHIPTSTGTFTHHISRRQTQTKNEGHAKLKQCHKQGQEKTKSKETNGDGQLSQYLPILD
jgi:hypothetical protein